MLTVEGDGGSQSWEGEVTVPGMNAEEGEAMEGIGEVRM
jgi:hypothetical protein